MKMNPVVHFEMPAKDRDRMSKFYTGVFGWEANKFGEDMGNYVMVMTTPSTQKGPTTPGAINGGFYPITNDAPNPSIVIQVYDIKVHMKLVEQAGGKILGEPVEISGVGWYVSFIDTEGNRCSLLQSTEQKA